MGKKVKKKRIRILPCIILILVLCFLYIIISSLYNIPVKNIFVYGNTILNDQEIIDIAELDDYPKYYSFTKRKIVKKLEQNPYIEEVSVKRSFFHVIKIYVKEYKILLYDYSTNKYILSDGEKIDTNKVSNRGIPTLVKNKNIYT